MRFSTLIALGACQAGAALAASPTSSSYKSPDQPKPTAPVGDATPHQVGYFDYHGCVKLSGSFDKISTNEDMSLDFCAASCPSPVFGVYSK